MIIISFDYDGTLTEPKIVNLALLFKSLGVKLRVTTRRDLDAWQDLGFISKMKLLELDKDSVDCTANQDKWIYLKKSGVNYHFDDDLHEIQLIRKNFSECQGCYIGDYEFVYHNGVMVPLEAVFKESQNE